MASEHTDILPQSSQPATTREVTLLILEGPGAGQRIPLDRDELKIGKDPSSDLCIPDAAVSRNHCLIERKNEGYLIRDLDSTNGTFVDGTRIREAYLRPGSRVKIGTAMLLFQPVYQADTVPPSKAESFGTLLGRSLAMRRIFSVLERVAPTDATILLTGPTGTGKGAAARSLHDASKRARQPYVVIDCGAVSHSLIEGELFGAEKGAYTGATVARAGALEAANGGTLFLDEIDDLPLELQPKLLRVLEEREIRRLGSTRPRKLDIRVIAATKSDLGRMVSEGRFRDDLFFRLAVVRVDLPKLAERTEDLALLADGFLDEVGGWEKLSPDLREQLVAHSWPGNVRELRNVLERLRYLGLEGADGVELDSPLDAQSVDEEVPAGVLPEVDFFQPFKEAKESLVDAFEREYLERLLERAGGRIATAAREARLNRKYFYDLLRKHGLYQKNR